MLGRVPLTPGRDSAFIVLASGCVVLGCCCSEERPFTEVLDRNDSIKPAQRESGSLPPCWVRSFTHRGVRIGAKNVRQRLRFTRALLESKDLFMWFCLPLYVWVSGHNPSSVEKTPEQRSPRICFSPMLGTRDHRRQEKQASFRQEEAANRPVFGSLYLQGMG